MEIDAPGDWQSRCDRVIPPCYRWATLGHVALREMIPCEILSQATEVAKIGKSIMFTGPTGSGKTVLAAALLRASEAEVPAFSSVCTYAYFFEKSDYVEFFCSENSDVAIVDGLDGLRAIHPRVRQILGSRLASGRQTFATSLHDRNYIVETVGADVADGFEFIELPYRDWRNLHLDVGPRQP